MNDFWKCSSHFKSEKRLNWFILLKPYKTGLEENEIQMRYLKTLFSNEVSKCLFF